MLDLGVCVWYAKTQHLFRREARFCDRQTLIELSKLTPMHVSRWRKWLQESPIVSGHRKGEARSASALNRDLSPLRAALNRALADGLVSSDFAWRQQLKPIPGAGSRRNHYFTKEQRAALRDGAREDFQELLTLVFALPIRAGAIAQLRVSHFDCNLRTLTIGKDKFGANRQVKLPPSIASVIEDFCKDKPLYAHIVNQKTGRPGDKDAWKDLFKKAAVIAELPEDSVMTNLRHSSLTDLMQSGIDPLTVAQLAGTSISMIQKHYGHLTQDRAQAALENLFIA